MNIHSKAFTVITLLLICVSGQASPKKGEEVRIRHQSKFLRLNHAASPSKDDEATDFRVCGVSMDLPVLKSPMDWQPLQKRPDVRRSSDEVGDVRTFSAIDFTTTPSDFSEIVARAERKGRHAIIYVDTTETFQDEDLDEVLSLFDQRIYTTNIAVFGAEPNPGIDGDPLITILFLPIEESAETVGDVAGYFWSGNQFSRNDVEQSNEREMLYIDVARLDRNGPTDAGSTIAHEFQHLIHWNHDRDEERWINEGLSEYATFVNDFEPSNPLFVFLNNTDFQLSQWTNHPRDYVRSFLWVLYLAEHYGGNSLIRRIVANPANGLSGLMSEVRSSSPATSFDEVLRDWFIANYLDSVVDSETPFDYPSIELPALRPTTTFGFLPIGTRTADVHAQAADYYLFSGGENIVVNLTGPATESAFNAKILRIGTNSAPEILDFPFNDFNDGSLAIPDFSSDSEQLVLVPYFFGDSSPGISYEFSAGGTGGPSSFADTLQHHDRESQTIVPFGLPSPVVNSEHIDSYAVRFTPSSDGRLVGAGLGVWRRTGSGGTVRMFLYDNVGDSAGVPNLKIDSVDVENVTGTPGAITWNYADFSQRNLPVKAGEPFHLAWEFVDGGPADTVVAILDTARVPTDRTTLFVRERQIWSRFVSRFNLFMRAIVTVPADPTVPVLTVGALQNPVFSQAFDVFAISQRPLNPVSVEGTLTLADSVHILRFRALDDSNKVFVDDGFKLFDSGETSILVSSRHQFGTVAGRDSLTFNVNLVDFERGGDVTSSDASFLLKIPPQAIPETTFFTTFDLKDDFAWRGKELAFPQEIGRPTGLQFTVGPAQLSFEKMATLSFNYQHNQNAQLSESDLAIAMFDGKQWLVLGGELYRDQKSISVLVDRTGVFSLIDKGDASWVDDGATPTDFFLSQNYPNPFNPVTTIRFGLPVASHTTLRVVNLRGQVISTLLDESLRAGEHLVEWDSTDDRKIPVASGVYLYQLKAKDYIQTRKLVVVK